MAIYAPKAIQSLLNFKDIRENNLHINTCIDNNKEILLFMAKTTKGTEVRGTLLALLASLYAIEIVIFLR
jgi:hypothetical protein